MFYIPSVWPLEVLSLTAIAYLPLTWGVHLSLSGPSRPRDSIPLIPVASYPWLGECSERSGCDHACYTSVRILVLVTKYHSVTTLAETIFAAFKRGRLASLIIRQDPDTDLRRTTLLLVQISSAYHSQMAKSCKWSRKMRNPQRPLTNTKLYLLGCV